jgi:hypothetical protein
VRNRAGMSGPAGALTLPCALRRRAHVPCPYLAQSLSAANFAAMSRRQPGQHQAATKVSREAAAPTDANAHHAPDFLSTPSFNVRLRLMPFPKLHVKQRLRHHRPLAIRCGCQNRAKLGRHTTTSRAALLITLVYTSIRIYACHLMCVCARVCSTCVCYACND